MKITNYLTTLINQALATLQLENNFTINLEHPADTQFGDYSTNIALVAFGQLSHQQTIDLEVTNPRQMAQLIATRMQEILKTQTASQMVTHIEVAGPGFINFTLSNSFLISEMLKLTTDLVPQIQVELKPVLSQYFDRKIVVEYSSPNIAKPFTIGHLRSTIIGDAIANLLQTVGAEIYRDNHLGDWGTQFGKQIYAIKTWGDEAVIENSDRPVKLLVELYVKFHQEAEQHPEIEDEGRLWFKKLEEGDPEARVLWKKCIDWSWKEFDQIYQRLGVRFTENEGRGYGESYFEDKMTPVLSELKERHLLTDSEGAQLVFFKNDKLPPLMVTKKDGATLYATRDLATDRFRLEKYGQNTLIINEVGAEQSLYFKQLFETERLLGWIQPEQRIHVGHGLYRFKDKKMSTRKGNVIWLEDVLLEAFQRVQKRAKSELPDKSIWKIAVGAIKWHDLKREVNKNVVFDFDEMLSLQGNSGPYVQYTYVRCASILKKADPEIRYTNQHFDTLLINKVDLDYDLNEAEKDILKSIYTYYEVVKYASIELAPHYLCSYLYTLAQQFNTFYSQHSVLGEEVAASQRQFRLNLTLVVANLIRHGLQVLGIEVVEKM